VSIPRLDAALAEKVAFVVATLCRREREVADIDTHLQGPISDCLECIDALGLVAHFPGERVTLCSLSKQSELESTAKARLIRKIHDRVGEHVASRDRALSAVRRRVDDRELFHDFCEPPFRVGWAFIPPYDAAGTVRLGLWDYAALIFRGGDRKPTDQEWRAITYHCHSTLPLLFQVLRYRVRMFAPFAGPISQRYWDDASPPLRQKGLKPPWTISRAWRTASLSLDLRKSTFCMEQADESGKFATWLDQLGQILTRIAHEHGGVFDKFTGDGALVHFLERECEEILERPVMLSALACAVDMQTALDQHVSKLRELLRFDSELLGGGIGIDISDAFWKVDHRGNPITVGKGIVGACRICDTTPARRISLTNIAYEELRRAIGDEAHLKQAVLKNPHLRQELFASKEFKDEMKIRIWQFRKPPRFRYTSSSADIHRLCEEVYTRTERDT
jgi:class 3 adenylate cyclase